MDDKNQESHMVYEQGQRIGQYEVMRLLEQTSFGQAYLGEHMYLRTEVLIEVFQLPLLNELQESFLTQARALQQLEHPSILRLQKAGIQKHHPFLVTDYKPYRTFRQIYPQKTSQTIEAVWPYLQQVAEVLHYAHSQHVLHGYIRPENILLDTNDTLFLRGFAIEAAIQNRERLRYQRTGVRSEAVSYTAPERIQGRASPASDQYSLAVLVYELLSGTLPFAGSAIEIAHQQMHAPLPALRQKAPGIAPAVERAVMKALAKEPEERFPTIRAFVAALGQDKQQPSSTAEVSAAPAQPTGVIDLASLPPALRPAPALNPSTPALAANPAPAFTPPAGPMRGAGGPPAFTPPTDPAGGPATMGTIPAFSPPVTPPSGPPPGPAFSPPIGPGGGPYAAPTFAPPGPVRGPGLPNTTPAFAPPMPPTVPVAAPQMRTAPVPQSAPPPVNEPLAQRNDSPKVTRRAFAVGLVGLAALGGTGGWYLLSQRLAPPAALTVAPNVQAPATRTTVNHTNVLIFAGHLASVNALAWSPDGKLIASASDDTFVQIFEAGSGQRKAIYRGHTEEVAAVGWSPDGKLIASGGEDKTVQIWNASSGAKVLTYTGHKDRVNGVSWSSDSQSVASGSDDKSVQVWNASTAALTFTFLGHTAGVLCVGWQPDNTSVASGSYDGTLRDWATVQHGEHFNAGDQIFNYGGHGANEVSALAWSPDSNFIVSVGADQTAQISNGDDGTLRPPPFLDHRSTQQINRVLAVSWSPDGNSIASGDSEGNVYVWHVTGRKTFFRYQGHKGAVNAVAWSPDGKTIASASSDTTVHVWQPHT